VLKKDGETLTAPSLPLPGEALRAGPSTRPPAAVAEMLKAVGRAGGDQAPSTSAPCSRTVTKGTLPYNGGFSSCRNQQQPSTPDDYLRDWGRHHPHQLVAVSGGPSSTSTRAERGARWTRRRRLKLPGRPGSAGLRDWAPGGLASTRK